MKRIISVLFVSALLLCAVTLTSCDFNFFNPTTTTTTTPEHVHTFTSTTVKPTCASEGYTEYTCTECGYIYQDDFIDPTAEGHKFVYIEKVDPTCFQDGYEREVCSLCGSERIETIPAAHTWGAWEETKHATCTTVGEETRHCKYCTATDTREIATSHTYDSGVVVQPTCSSEGYTLYTCTECGVTKKEAFTSMLDHEYGEWIITKEPTCSEKGEKKHTCENCDAYEIMYIESRHNYGDLVFVKPTCAEPGCTKYVCKDCGYEKIVEYVTTNHVYGEWQTYIPYTCTTQGLERRYCTTCGAFEERISQPDHVYDIVEVVEPTRTSSGYTKHSCECGECYIDNIVSTAGSEGLEYTLKTFYDAETKQYVKTYTVVGLGECTDKEIVIPYMHNGIVVTSIRYDAFRESDITALYLPASITSINSTALWNCKDLKTIVFEGTLDEWDSISKATSWNYGLTGLKLVCIDGSRKYD